MPTILFYFDFSSPCAYIAFHQLPQVLADLAWQIQYRPVRQTILCNQSDEAASHADAASIAALTARVDDIFQACSFQDLTGQRIRKVIKTLTWIDERIAHLAQKLKLAGADAEPEDESEDERRMRELLLHGPQMKGDGVTQDAVDDFFALSDQEDIDKLFG